MLSVLDDIAVVDVCVPDQPGLDAGVLGRRLPRDPGFVGVAGAGAGGGVSAGGDFLLPVLSPGLSSVARERGCFFVVSVDPLS